MAITEDCMNVQTEVAIEEVVLHRRISDQEPEPSMTCEQSHRDDFIEQGIVSAYMRAVVCSDAEPKVTGARCDACAR